MGGGTVKTPESYNATVSKFDIVKDDYGYAMAIAVDGFFLIHLQRGTSRNEENAAKLLAVLNGAVAMVNNKTLAWVSGEDKQLRQALQDIMPTARKTFAASGGGEVGR
jgi:hypothetical protein